MRGLRTIPWRAVPSYVQRRLHFRARPWRYTLNRFAPALVSVTTSQTDRYDYNQICRRAARNPVAFATFKRHPSYRVVLEHVNQEQGQAYLDDIANRRPKLLEDYDHFRKNDRFGLPYTYEYPGVGKTSPTTLRYLKVLADLLDYFGDLAGARIIEIGSAYGGQCTVAAGAVTYASYTGVDLPAALELMQTYTTKLNIPNVELLRQSEVVGQASYDLAISNYSFSECTKATQDHYLEHVLKAARRGYITYNSGTNAADAPAWVPYNREQILERLTAMHEVTVLPETPQTGGKSDNFVIVWDDTTT